MRKLFLCLIIAALALPAFAQQSKNPVSDVLRESLPGHAKDMVAAFQEMPAEKYSFKPTPAQMSFGHLAIHIAAANYFFCANVGDVPKPKADEFTGTEAKDTLVAALQRSFDFCSTALAKADDSKLGDTIQGFDGKPKSRAWALLALASSWADHYGMAAMYLRLNGLTPPTAESKK